jgi:Mg2+ and Co2+ transporter CorA
MTAIAVSVQNGGEHVSHDGLILIVGPNYVVTVHEQDTDFLEALRQREQGDSAIGSLSAESFAASLLDWLLNTYFSVMDTIVHDVDRVEVSILGKKGPGKFLSELVRARRQVAHLRRALKSHREVFYGLARPDFTATERPEARPHFEALNKHYERAEDELETARDLVIGSFELLSTRAAQKTNETMRALTFVTVLMGSLALIAGIMGMNFELQFFKTGIHGFLIVSGSMLALSALAVWVAYRRSWI